MPPRIRILVVAGRPGLADQALGELRTAGSDPDGVVVASETEFVAALDPAPEIILAEYSGPGTDKESPFGALRAMEILHARKLEVPVIVVSPRLGEEAIIEGFRRGAADWVLEDGLGALPSTLSEALARHRKRKAAVGGTESVVLGPRDRTLMDCSNDAIFLCDAETGILLDANRKAEDLVGRPLVEILGMHQTELHPPEELDRYRGIFFEHAHRSGAITQDLEVVHRDGRRIPVDISASVLEIRGKRVVVGIFREATERRRAEAALRESEEKYRTMVEFSNDMIWTLDREGKYTFFNRRAYEASQYALSDWIGRSYEPLIVPDQLPRIKRIHEEVMKGKPLQYEVDARNQDGSIMTLSVTKAPIYAGKEIVGTVSFGRDITEQKKMETQLLRSQRLDSLGSLAGGIAHDLNNLLQPILLAAGALQERIADPQARRPLALIEESARRGADLVNQVMVFAKGTGATWAKLDPIRLLQEIEKVARETFPKSIQIVTSIPEGLWGVSGDATQFYQVLMNLALNARDAMPQGGTLTLACVNAMVDPALASLHPGARAGPHLVLSVADTGLGIQPGLLDRIFEPFFSTKDVGKGTGLGLSTARSIVMNHKGFLEVQSIPGRGSVFTVYLPSAEAPEAVPAGAELMEPLNGHGEVVLLVDDEAAIREIMKPSLESNGYRVLTAQDGVDALDVLWRHPQEVALALIDMLMPRMDGAATIRELRRIDPGLKIIAMSGYDQGTFFPAHERPQVDAFLVKPFGTERLLLELRRVLLAEPHPRSY